MIFVLRMASSVQFALRGRFFSFLTTFFLFPFLFVLSHQYFLQFSRQSLTEYQTMKQLNGSGIRANISMVSNKVCNSTMYIYTKQLCFCFNENRQQFQYISIWRNKQPLLNVMHFSNFQVNCDECQMKNIQIFRNNSKSYRNPTPFISAT